RDVRIVAHDAELAVALHLPEVHAPSGGVARELIPALLEREEETLLAIGRSTLQELRDRKRLARSRRAGDERHGITEKSSTAHLIELRIARRDALVGRLHAQVHRRQRNHDDAAVRDDRER